MVLAEAPAIGRRLVKEQDRDTAQGAALSDIRLVYFGVGDTPVRAREAELALTAGAIDGAVAALRDDIEPRGDVHASAAARLHLAGVLLRRVTAQLHGKSP